MQNVHLLLTFLFLLTGVLVIFSDNVVHSVLFLILTFCNACLILFIFNVEFLALFFIIIYVGAIAVLFLFVVMMLNVKTFFIFNVFNFSFIFLIALILLLQIYFIFGKVLFGYDNFLTLYTFKFDQFFDFLDNTNVIGQCLYNYFSVCFLIAGIVLLSALIGAIVLTLSFRSIRKSEISSRQLSRSDNFLSFFN
jgi:NADH-quinone oxidoreductase subunit J